MNLDSSEKLKLYRFLLLTREVDNAIIKLYKQGKMVGGAFTGYGNEATAVGSAFALEERDYLFPMHRDLGAHLVKGQTVRNIFLMQLGREAGLARGRDGTGHYADPSRKIYGNVSHLAAMIPMAVGVALASKMRKENAVVMNYIGDGGCNVGEFHDGMNMAAVMKLPFVLIIENNQFAYSTPNHKQFAAKRLSDRAVGYGIPGYTVDGTDVEAVYQVSKQAVDRAREGAGPTLIETITMRMHGHSLSDDASYVPKGMVEEWKKKDPLEVYEKDLVREGILSSSRKQEVHDAVLREIEDAVDYAAAMPYPPGEQATDGVLA